MENSLENITMAQVESVMETMISERNDYAGYELESDASPDEVPADYTYTIAAFVDIISVGNDLLDTRKSAGEVIRSMVEYLADRYQTVKKSYHTVSKAGYGTGNLGNVLLATVTVAEVLNVAIFRIAPNDISMKLVEIMRDSTTLSFNS